MTVIVYDNKHLHIIELEDTRPGFILFDLDRQSAYDIGKMTMI
jgi:hypothetical protein